MDNNKPFLRVLVACEYSGAVRDAFAAHPNVEAWSCDLLPSERPGLHYQGPVEDLLEGWMPLDGDSLYQGQSAEFHKDKPLFRPLSHLHWDVSINHPPCTYLCSSGLHWNKRRPERSALTEQALDFAVTLMNAPIKYKVLENPVGCISTRIRKPDQTIQP